MTEENNPAGEKLEADGGKKPPYIPGCNLPEQEDNLLPWS
jgi:hypothetical protein